MKQFLQNHWLKVFIVALISILIIIYLNRKKIGENKIVKAKIELFKATQNHDFERVKEVLDTFKIQ